MVLPFVNLSGDATLGDWCDALTEELIDALVQVPGLKVVARTTSFSFRARQDDVRNIARRVGVRTVLEGSVQSRPGGRRVVAQLIDGGNGLHPVVACIRDRCRRRRVDPRPRAGAGDHPRSLALQAGRPALTRAARRISADARAREAWQRGRYLMGRHTRSAYRDAAVLFDQALGADPAFALAWASRAQACIGQLGLSPAPDAAILADAHAAVARALELDPELGEAHAAAATLAFSHDRDFVRAERASLEAIRYAPGRATTCTTAMRGP